MKCPECGKVHRTRSGAYACITNLENEFSHLVIISLIKGTRNEEYWKISSKLNQMKSIVEALKK